MRQELALITAALLTANGNSPWRFEDPIEVQHPFTTVFVYGLWVSKENDLYAMTLEDDGNGSPVEDWNKVEDEERAEKVVHAIYNRIFKTKAIAS